MSCLNNQTMPRSSMSMISYKLLLCNTILYIDIVIMQLLKKGTTGVYNCYLKLKLTICLQQFTYSSKSIGFFFLHHRHVFH